MSDHASRPMSMVIYARDCRILADFYARMLQLSRAEEDDDFVQLASASLELVVVQAPPHIRDSIVLESPPLLREETPLKLSFAVQDVEALRDLIVAAGGGLKPCTAGWEAWATRHLDGWDPEGNVFQLRELVR